MNRFIEHIINDLVRDTKIDYDREEIHFPSYPHPTLLFSLSYRLLTFDSSNSFIMYCKDKYGLTEEEIKYVWDQYKTIIKDKIDNK